MSYIIINENRYDIPELDFDAVCELEENGVDLLAMNKNNPKLATMVRGFTAWIMGCDSKTASEEIEEHIANGGSLADILTSVSRAIESSGFFNQRGRKQPQDHEVKQYPGKKQQQHQGNRAQRRASNKNRGNGSRSPR